MDFKVVIPWVLLAFMGGFFINSFLNKDTKEVTKPEESVSSNYFSMVKPEDAEFLSYLSNHIANYIEKDSSVLTERSHVLSLINNTGLVMSYERGQIQGLGEALSKYFDEDKEFPQLSGKLTSEDRIMAANAWRKISQDLQVK